MKNVWTCTFCDKTVKTDRPEKCSCGHPPGYSWTSCNGPGGCGRCDPGSCYRCDQDRERIGDD